MTVKQISIFVENRTGRLAELVNVLAQGGVNMQAMCTVEASSFGILRLIVDDPERAEKILKEHHYICSVNDVLCVLVSDRPGGLADALNALAGAGVAIEYSYAFITRKTGSAYMILRVEDNAAAAALLTGAGVKLVQQEEFFLL